MPESDAPDTNASATQTDHPYFESTTPHRHLCEICNLGPPAHLTIAGPGDDIRDYLTSEKSAEDDGAGRIQEINFQSPLSQIKSVHERSEAEVRKLAKRAFVEAHEGELLRNQEEVRRQVIMQNEGHKDDAGKPPFQFLPWEALEEVAYVMEYGAEKYKPGNYRKGMNTFRLMRACVGHWASWWKGEDNDPETGRSHIAHAACCCLMAIECIKLGTAKDARYTR